MPNQSHLLIPPGGGTATNVIGNPITIKIHGRDTGGVFALIETLDQPDQGPPAHIQGREDETFYVLEGEYEFMCGGKIFSAKPGTTVWLPRGVPHQYKCISNTPGRLLTVITPAGFEDFFVETNGLTDLGKVLAIGAKFGFQVAPPA